MKIMTVLGTRPEIIRLSRVIPIIDSVTNHVLIHTGQNYSSNLNEIFFDEMGIRKPDVFLDAKGSFGQQIGTILSKCENIIRDEKPDKFLILGDTNSALSAFVAKRLSIPVYHMEAGNRCFDDRVPEEVNRKVIDHSSDILLPYTERSRQNLIKEGFPEKSIYVTGNPILEVIEYYSEKIHNSNILTQLKLSQSEYFLVTLHRSENVDDEKRLSIFARSLDVIQKKYKMPIIVSTHPHTKDRLHSFGIGMSNNQIRLLEPFGFFDFITLEKNSLCVLSDSGTVQEECSIFNIPNVTLRDVTERPETLECGSNILSGANTEQIELCIKIALDNKADWSPPIEYLSKNVSRTVAKILMGYNG